MVRIIAVFAHPKAPPMMWTQDCLSSRDGLGSLSSWQRGCVDAAAGDVRSAPQLTPNSGQCETGGMIPPTC